MDATDSELTGPATQEFYNTQKQTVWEIRIHGVNLRTVGTAFALSSAGLLMTSAHFFPRTPYTIRARRLGGDGEFHQAGLVYEKPEWGIVLVQVRGCATEVPYGVLANDGSLSVFQTLYHIGNFENIQGLFLSGTVSFPCVNDVELPVSNETCANYTPTTQWITPRYRIMGHVWNQLEYSHPPSAESSYKENLHPSIPIVQIQLWDCFVGGPLFNHLGEIVGMGVGSASGFQFAVHVSVLKEILRLKELSLSNEEGERGETSDPTFQGGDSENLNTLPAI